MLHLVVCFRCSTGWAAKIWSVALVLATSGLVYTARILSFLTLDLRF